MSYTTFRFDDLQLAAVPAATAPHDGPKAQLALPPCSALRVGLTVVNTGTARGAEVVQVYVSRLGGADDPTPRVSLAAFVRTPELAPGASAALTVTLEPQRLAVVRVSRREGGARSTAGWMWTNGTANLWVGGRQPTVAEVNNPGGRQQHPSGIALVRDAERSMPPGIGRQISSSTGVMTPLLHVSVALLGPAARCSGFDVYQAPAAAPGNSHGMGHE